MQKLDDKLKRHDQSDIEIHSQGGGQEQRYIRLYFRVTNSIGLGRLTETPHL